MIPYIYLLVIVLVLSSLSSKHNKYIEIVFILILSAFVFFRDETVGTDTVGYCYNYLMLTDDQKSWNPFIIFEPGYNIFLTFFKDYISENPMDVFGFCGIIYVLGFYFYIKKYDLNRTILLLLFFTLYGSYFLSYNIIRQCFALGLIMLLFAYIDIRNLNRKKRIILAIGISLIAFLIHNTMFICLIVLLNNTKIYKKLMTKKVLIILLIISYILFLSKVILNYVFPIINYFGMVGKFANYMTRTISQGEDSGFSSLKLTAITLFQIYTIYISKDTKNIFIFFSTFAVIFLNLFVIIVMEMVRVYEIPMCLGLISFALPWDYNKKEIKERIYCFISFSYMLFSYINIIVKDYGAIEPYTLRF